MAGMFTGIVEMTAEVLDPTPARFRVARPASFTDIRIGSSIAVSGVCLTVTSLDAQAMEFTVIQETLDKSRLGSFRKGDRVNLERAMKADSRLDGHIVQGHVEGTGIVLHAPSPAPLPRNGGGDGGGGVNRKIDKKRYPARAVVNHARDMRKGPTTAEAILWETLRGKRLNGLYFRRQRPIGNFIVDFYNEELHLAIELDGSIHDVSEQRDYDRDREEELTARGVRILRFSNDQVLNNLDEVLAAILKIDQNILSIRLPKELIKNIVHKGSVTIDGVSLTVAGMVGDTVSVALIPFTIKETTLGDLKKGEKVNIETDILRRFARE